MCGRIVWVWDAKTGRLLRKLVDEPEADPEVARVLHKNRYNVPPASHLPFVVGHREGNTMEIARWGFPIPQRPNGVFNTRIESAFESPMWRGLIGQHHALLAVKGFYEWHRRSGKKSTPHFIHRSDGEPLLLAALTGFRKIDGESRRCASVVTCPPNHLIEPLHDRMPVIIEAADAQAWLHPKDHDAVLALAAPAAPGVLAMHEVRPAVNSTANDSPKLPEPKGTPAKGQATLDV